MLKQLHGKIIEALISVLPVTLIVILLNLTPLVDFSAKEIGVFCFSAFLLLIGIGLFNLGADLAMTPMGKYVGEGLTRSGKLLLLLIVCFAMGVLITVAAATLAIWLIAVIIASVHEWGTSASYIVVEEINVLEDGETIPPMEVE